MMQITFQLTQVRLHLAWLGQTLVWCERVVFLGRQEQDDEAGK